MIPAAMIQFTNPIARGVAPPATWRQRSRFALGQQIEHVVVEFFVDFTVQRVPEKCDMPPVADQHLALRTVDDFSNRSAELIAAPRVRNRRT
jgi:hypothetical protein